MWYDTDYYTVWNNQWWRNDRTQLCFPCIWASLEKIFPAEVEQRYKDNNDPKNIKYIKQYMAYQTKLENKNIFETFTAAYEDIINEVRHSWSVNQVRHYKQSPQDYCKIELQSI